MTTFSHVVDQVFREWRVVENDTNTTRLFWVCELWDVETIECRLMVVTICSFRRRPTPIWRRSCRSVSVTRCRSCSERWTTRRWRPPSSCWRGSYLPPSSLPSGDCILPIGNQAKIVNRQTVLFRWCCQIIQTTISPSLSLSLSLSISLSFSRLSISARCCLDGSSIYQPILCCSSQSPDTSPHPVHIVQPRSLWPFTFPSSINFYSVWCLLCVRNNLIFYL